MGLTSGCFAMVACMLLANLFITPLYMATSMAAVAAMIPTLLLPFNIVKGILNVGVTLLLYKPLSKMLRKLGLGKALEIKPSQEKSQKNNKRSVIVFIVSLAIIVISLYVIITVLGGNIVFFDK